MPFIIQSFKEKNVTNQETVYLLTHLGIYLNVLSRISDNRVGLYFTWLVFQWTLSETEKKWK